MRSPRSLNQNNLYQSTLTIQNSYDLPMAITYIIVNLPYPWVCACIRGERTSLFQACL